MDETNAKLEELDGMLNDPDVPMSARRVWELLEELAAAPAPEHAFTSA